MARNGKPPLFPQAFMATPALPGGRLPQPGIRCGRTGGAVDSGHRVSGAGRRVFLTLVPRPGQVADDPPQVRQVDHQLADVRGDFTHHEVGDHGEHVGQLLPDLL